MSQIQNDEVYIYGPTITTSIKPPTTWFINLPHSNAEVQERTKKGHLEEKTRRRSISKNLLLLLIQYTRSL